MSAASSRAWDGTAFLAPILALALGLLSPCLVYAEDGPYRGGRPDGFQAARPGEISPDKLERWRSMPPEERERIRERYHRWKELPPEKKERILERRRRWRELPEPERRFLRERREIYRNAPSEDKQVIKRFYRHWRELPPERRDSMRRDFEDWRGMPGAEREERMRNWRFYRQLPREERRVIRRFLLSEPPPDRPPGPHSGSPGYSPPAGPRIPDRAPRPPR